MTSLLDLDIQYIHLNQENTTIAYVDQGEGIDTLLFIHGLGNSLIGWEQNLLSLHKHSRCIAIDLPGNGFSKKADIHYSIQYYASIIAEFIQALNLKNVTLVGHSMGGQVAILATYLFPQLFNKLILVAPAGFEQFNQIEKMLMKSSAQLLDFTVSDASKLKHALQSSFYNLNSHSKDMIQRMVKLLDLQPQVHYKRMVDQCISSMLDTDVWNILPKIDKATLVLFGDMDSLIPNKLFHPYTTKYIAEKGTKRFPNASLKMIPLGGHFIHWEQAATVNKAIISFLKD